MLISHKYKFIFIHVWKTGGTSIYESLLPFTEKDTQPSFFDLLLNRKRKPISLDFEKHITGPELIEKIDPKIYNKYFKFAFVRNPLSWEVSYYHFITQQPNNHPERETIIKLGSFEAFIDWAAEHEMEKHSQKQFVYSGDKKIVDLICKYEQFNEDLEQVKSILGFPKFEIQHVNKSKHDDYMKYYTPRTEAIVRHVLKEDFKLFNY